MEIIEYVATSDSKGAVVKYFVEISDVPWYKATWYAFWEKLDPCCRKPGWLWQYLVRVEFAVHIKREDEIKSVVEVDEEWARAHFPWDISIMKD